MVPPPNVALVSVWQAQIDKVSFEGTECTWLKWLPRRPFWLKCQNSFLFPPSQPLGESQKRSLVTGVRQTAKFLVGRGQLGVGS